MSNSKHDSIPWDLFDRRLTNAEVHAFQFIEQAGHSANLHDYLGENIPLTHNKALVATFRRAHLLEIQGSDEIGKQSLLEIKQAILKEQQSRSSETYQSSPSQEKLAGYTNLMDFYLSAQAAVSQTKFRDAESALSVGLQDWQHVADIEPADYLSEDMQKYRVDALVLLGDICHQTKRPDDAEKHYRVALNLAIATNNPRLIAGPRYKLSGLYRQVAQYDEALKILLPLRTEFQKNSLPSVEVCCDLASLYCSIGDFFESKKALEEAEKQLEQIGFHLPFTISEDAFLTAWIEATHKLTWPDRDFASVFYKVGTLQLQIQATRELVSTEDSETKRFQERQRKINDLILMCSQKSDSIWERDGEIQNKIFQEMSGPGAAVKFDGGLAVGGYDGLAGIRNLDDRVNDVTRQLQENPNDAAFAAVDEILAELSPNNKYTYGLLLIKGDALLEMDREDEAMDAWRFGLAQTKEAGAYDVALNFIERLLFSKSIQADQSVFLALAREAIELIEDYRYGVSPAYLQSGFLADKVQFYGLAVLAAWKLKDYETMLRVADLTKGWASTKTYEALKTRKPDKELQSLTNELIKITGEGAVPDSEGEHDEYRRILWDRIALRASASAGYHPELQLKELQNQLAADQAILHYYWLADGVLMISCITRDSVRAIRQIMVDDYHKLLAFSPAMRRHAQLRSASSPIRAIWFGPESANADTGLQSLASWLLPDEIRQMLLPIRRLWISPHRILHSIPLHALRVDGQYLIERCAVSYVPNLGVFRSVPYQENHKRVFLAGTDQYHIADTPLNTLPGVAREIEAISKTYSRSDYQVEKLFGINVTRAKLRSMAAEGALSSYALLHFATHGSDIPTDLPMEDRLYTSDGHIDGLEISTWMLNADLVILSACDSGKRAVAGRGMESLPGDEIFGLQASFFNAGARRVLGTLWPVDDNAATSIMTAFHARFVESQDYAGALQSAVKDYLAESKNDEDDLFCWAPFFLTEREVGMGSL